MRAKRRPLGGIVLALAAAAVATAAPQSPQAPAAEGSPAIPSAPPIAIPPPLPGGPAPDLDLIFTGQVAGYVEPCG